MNRQIVRVVPATTFSPRSRLLVETFASLLFPTVVVDVVGAQSTSSPPPSANRSVPCISPRCICSRWRTGSCVRIGIAFSAVASWGAIAERGTEAYDWLQYVSPRHYYDPTPILFDRRDV